MTTDAAFTVRVLWVSLAGVVAVLMMGIDKLLAKTGASRISERTLWLAALFGGFWGIMIGASIFHHKTSKESFWIPVIAATALWASALTYLAL